MKKRKVKLLIKKILKSLNFSNMPIKTKLFLVFSFVFIAMILLSFIIYSNYRKDKESGILDLISQMNVQTIKKIDSYIDDLGNITKAPLLKDDNNNYNETFLALEASNNGEVDFHSSRKLDNETFNLLMIKPSLHSVFIFNTKGKGGYTLRGMELSPTAFIPVNEKWFKKTLAAKGSPVFVSSFLLPVSSSTDKILVFSVARGIKNVDEEKMIGVILVNSRIEILDNFIKDMLVYPHQKITIVDDEGRIIYDMDRKKITQKLDSHVLGLIGEDHGFYKNIEIGGLECLLSYQKSELTGMKIINTIPIEELNTNLDKMSIATILVTFTILVISLFFVLILSSIIVNPLKKLALTMHLVEKGDFDMRIVSNRSDEIGELSKSYNRMAVKIKRLIREVYLDKINQKELELQMLKNQINPHFLYNSLESIRMVAEVDGNENVSDMLYSLGNILRYGISLKKEIVTVRDEIEHLKDYILLQKVRFEDIFVIELDINESIYDMNILKLILQPILENAIYHGLSQIASGGIIKISGFSHEGNIVFEVSDNGSGMEKDRLQMLNDYIHGVNDSFKSIGLKNVQRRIELYYGLGYGLQISSVFGEGTTVRVTLPPFHM
jgi:two-component system, sensor histidine kinase YesM